MIFAACGGDATAPDPTPVVSAPASLALVTSPVTGLAAGDALQPAPVIELRDAAGKPVAKAGVSITATLVGGTASGATSATTGANGRATFPGILVSGPPGAHELRFSSTGLTGVSLAITLTSGAPAGMKAASAQLQNAAAGATAPEAPAVHLVDANGNPVSGATVQFTVLSGGGHVGVPTPVTDASGTATAGAWTLGAGLNLLQAVSGRDTVLFRAGGASSPVQSVVAASRTSQTIVTGQELSEQPAVKVLGEGGTPVAGALVVFGGVSGLALLDDSLAISDAGGIATAGHWRVVAAGAQRLIGSVPATSLESIDFNVTAVQSGTLAASGWVENQIFKTGTALETAPTVVVTSGDKPLAGVAVTFSTTADADAPVTTTVITNAAGVAQAPAWTLGGEAGIQVMTAGAPGFTPQSVAFGVFVVEAPPVTIRIFAGDSQSGTVLTPLAVDPAVKVTDDAGAPVVGYPVAFSTSHGKIEDTLAFTNSDGIASAGHWTMPASNSSPSALMLWVQAPLLNGSPLVFHASSIGGGPATIARSDYPLQGVVGGQSILPSINVYDAGGMPLEGVSVTAAVVPGHGSVTFNGVTGVAGHWEPTSWILDTIAGVNELTVTVEGLPPITFTSTGLPGEVASMTVDGDLQSAPIYSPVQVSVHLADQYGNRTPNVAVHFASSADGRTLPGAGLVGTDSTGTARIDWRMGSTPGSYSLTALASGDAGLTRTLSASATSITSAFDIKVQYLGGAPSSAMESAVAAAVARWRAIQKSDQPDATLNRDAAECFANQPAISETVDDILIYIETDAIDDVGGILGAAGPCLIRSLSRLPSMGYMHLDVADVAQLAASGQLQDVVLHEMGHILGIGTLWEDRSFVLNPGSSDPRYTGTAGVQGYRDLGGLSSTVPLENSGGAGTADTHWREATFGYELMTGYISGSDNALTGMTIGALQDLGYTVSYAPSEPLSVAAGTMAQLRTRPRRLIERMLPSPIIVLDQGGREVGRERRPY
jgi:hypothetical protein